MTQDRWPELPYAARSDTYATLHMWTQIVGKVVLARAAPVNHSWGIAFHLTARGLRTARLTCEDRSFTMAFDFVDHQLEIETSDGARRALPLVPRSVADFYRDVIGALNEMGLATRIWPVAVELPVAIRLDQDVAHHSYDREYVERWWQVLMRVHDVFATCRCAFVGKSSPVHFFWGSFDLAVTRFSGRPAPPREGPAFMREAYSHEVISHGFWPGSGPILEPALYAYAVPEPEGLKTAAIQPEGAYYHREMNEFILPYDVVRGAASPGEAIAAFVNSTYEQAATLGKWDRASLERK